ncbi:MAG TPA: helix-turn-helix transcriptional regulator [Gammaproteobacteria bacterium]|nr:helix-turn-helix transcriptional regulator [Gammaproteobacteria bacterium]
MKKRVKSPHGPRSVTPAGRSVFRELFSEAAAEELEIRAELLRGLNRWLSGKDLTQVEAAKELGVTQARISDIKRGKINQFSMDLLVRLAARAGLHPRLKLVA